MDQFNNDDVHTAETIFIERQQLEKVTLPGQPLDLCNRKPDECERRIRGITPFCRECQVRPEQRMDELQRLALNLQMMVLHDVTGHDADAAASWADELVEETCAEKPRLYMLRVYLDEIEKKATRSRELRDQIEAVRRLIV